MPPRFQTRCGAHRLPDKESRICPEFRIRRPPLFLRHYPESHKAEGLGPLYETNSFHPPGFPPLDPRQVSQRPRAIKPIEPVIAEPLRLDKDRPRSPEERRSEVGSSPPVFQLAAKAF